jgi:dienelactone hydrolase
MENTMHRLLRRTLWSIGGALLLIPLLLVWGTVSRVIPATLPPPTGPYAVGRMEFDWIDQSRPDPFVSGKQNRELDVFVWYPVDRSGTKRATYLREDWLRNLDLSFPWPTYRGVRTHSWEDASPIRRNGAPWPVVIFSPGFGPVPAEYTSFGEQLASEGYIVAAPANTYTGRTVVFPDGRIAKSKDEGWEPGKLLAVCASDIGTVLKELHVLNEDSRSPFFQIIDSARAGIVGHSWGGAASAEFCSTDDRCTAGVDLDGGLYGGAAQNGIRQPFLFLLGEGTPPYWLRAQMLVHPHLRTKWEEFMKDENASFRSACGSSPNCQVERLPGIRHLNFSDVGVLFRRPLYWAHPMLGRAGGEEGVRITRQKLSEFLNRWVRRTSQ